MFAQIQTEVLDRTMTARLYFTAASTLAGPRVAGTVRGLVFVQLYAIYEYTITKSIEGGFAAATGHSMPTNALLDGMLALALDADFMSFSNISRRNSWARRLEFLRKANSTDPADFSGIEFPDDGSHFRPDQLKTIWRLLGINKTIVPDPKYLGRIQELVEHRNAIAHGRSTADEIGGRFSTADISARIEDVQAICLHILQTIDDHCSNAAPLCR